MNKNNKEHFFVLKKMHKGWGNKGTQNITIRLLHHFMLSLPQVSDITKAMSFPIMYVQLHLEGTKHTAMDHMKFPERFHRY